MAVNHHDARPLPLSMNLSKEGWFRAMSARGRVISGLPMGSSDSVAMQLAVLPSISGAVGGHPRHLAVLDEAGRGDDLPTNSDPWPPKPATHIGGKILAP